MLINDDDIDGEDFDAEYDDDDDDDDNDYGDGDDVDFDDGGDDVDDDVLKVYISIYIYIYIQLSIIKLCLFKSNLFFYVIDFDCTHNTCLWFFFIVYGNVKFLIEMKLWGSHILQRNLTC